MWLVYYKHREKIQKFKETDDLNYIFNKESDQACLAHDAVYVDGKNLASRTASDKI